MECLAQLATKYKDLAILVTWSLTALGWFYNARTASQREVRKEVRKEVDDCIKAAYELLQLTKDYYYDTERTKDAERTTRVRFDLQRLLTRVERLGSRCTKISAGGQLASLMDNLTGDDFDAATRAVLMPRDSRVRQMEAAVHGLIDTLEAGFLNQFPD
jgi:hypothetical protein